MKYVRVMDGLKSNAGGFEYKLDEVNISKNWNPTTLEPEKMGGFNFGTEDKILRWIHRGDTIYNVIIPDDAEVVLCDIEKGIYRSNKIIVTNPQKLTKELIIDYYKKTTLSDKVLAQCLYIMLWKNMPEVSEFIINDRVNKDNIDIYLNEFGNYGCNGDFSYDKLGDEAKKIYDMLLKIKNE
jgi:hypothetical protein